MKKGRNLLAYGLGVVASCWMAACGSGDGNEGQRQTTSPLRAGIDSIKGTSFFTEQELRPLQQQELERFYSSRNYETAWSRGDTVLPLVDSLIVALDSAGAEGLDPKIYQITELKRLRDAAKEDSAANRPETTKQLEILATTQYLKYASHLLAGRLDPHTIDTNWIAHPRQMDLNEHLQNALQNNNIRQSLQKLSPDHPQYALLKNELARYRKIAAGGGWAAVSAGNSTQRSSLNSNNALLRQRLAFDRLADSAAASGSGNNRQIPVIDESIRLRQFQQLHGLDTTGMLDEATLKALNRPVEEVIGTIQINMEHLRWRPESSGDRYLTVNVPESRLKAYENGAQTMDMRVIVGDEYAATPIFTDTLEYIMFSPDWTIPLTIARREILPMLQQNPGYLEKRNMVLYDSWDTLNAKKLNPRQINWRNMPASTFEYRIVQKPGPDNPMGRMKFMLPNPLFIYLHDTPASHLFEANNRAVSHGCIRVEQPDELVNYVLAGNPGWTGEQLVRYTKLKEPKRVDLHDKVPIAITYHTAWVDEQNRLQMRHDIYGLDQKQIQAIQLKEQITSQNSQAYERNIPQSDR